MRERVLTAPIGAAGLIGGFAIALATGSRPLGGVVLALCGGTCIAVWLRRDGPRIAAVLGLAGVVGFAGSHVLGHVIGAWPAVLAVSAGCAALCWRLSDRRVVRRREGISADRSAEAGVRL